MTLPGTAISDDAIIDEILGREGGYVDHPADRGGPTRFGITQATLGLWRGRPVDAAAVRALSRDEARDILTSRYLVRPGFTRVTDRTKRAHLVDCAVLHGPARATRLVQQAVGARIDGLFGPDTARRVNLRGPASFHAALARERIRFLGRLISDDPTQAAFAAGWLNRATAFLA